MSFTGFLILINKTKILLGKFPTLSRSQILSDNGIGQSQGVHPSQSFSRLDSSRSTPAIRSRASTLQNTRDIFEKSNSDTEMAISRTNHAISSPSQELPHGFDELPIELMSLIDRYGVNLFLWEMLIGDIGSLSPSLQRSIALLHQSTGCQTSSKTFMSKRRHIFLLIYKRSPPVSPEKLLQLRHSSPSPQIPSKTARGLDPCRLKIQQKL